MTTTDATRCAVCGGEFSRQRVHIEGKQYHPRCAIASHGTHTYEDVVRLSAEIERMRVPIVALIKHLNETDDTIPPEIYDQMRAIAAPYLP